MPSVTAGVVALLVVTIVVAFAAGGPFENIRPLGQFLEKSLGRPFIIENRPGAGGLIHDVMVLPDASTFGGSSITLAAA